jgi:hypothetical protein
MNRSYPNPPRAPMPVPVANGDLPYDCATMVTFLQPKTGIEARGRELRYLFLAFLL